MLGAPRVHYDDTADLREERRHFIRILKCIRSLGGAWKQFPILDGPLNKSGKIQIPGKAGSCETIEDRLLPALSVRRGTAVPRARATLVERALRARFHLWIRRRDGSGLAQLNLFTVLHAALRRHDP